jgi:hypothetical protein
MSVLFAAFALAQVAAPLASTPAAPMICKRIVPVGSLSRARKDCRTKEDWDRMTRSAQEATSDYQGAGWAAGDEGTREAQNKNPMNNGAPF